jgi:prepilin-type N-terminal cleavage/methylation domain-containing protein
MNKDGGFTLVEIIVTILVIGVAIGSLSSMFIVVRNIQTRTLYYDTAHRAAAREIESLRNDSYDALVAGQTLTFTSDISTILPSRTGTAVISAPSTGIRRIDATVTYKLGGKTQTVTLSSLIGEIGITQ